MTTQQAPAMIIGDAYRDAMEQAAGQPVRMVPYFDPGVWGGTWMKTHFGLHECEFIDTYRISTSAEIPIHRNGSVHMLNLVEGECILLVSEDGRFTPMELHYAETCIVPEAAGTYLVCSPDNKPVQIIIACVRS